MQKFKKLIIGYLLIISLFSVGSAANAAPDVELSEALAARARLASEYEKAQGDFILAQCNATMAIAEAKDKQSEAQRKQAKTRSTARRKKVQIKDVTAQFEIAEVIAKAKEKQDEADKLQKTLDETRQSLDRVQNQIIQIKTKIALSAIKSGKGHFKIETIVVQYYISAGVNFLFLHQWENGIPSAPQKEIKCSVEFKDNLKTLRIRFFNPKTLCPNNAYGSFIFKKTNIKNNFLTQLFAFEKSTPEAFYLV